MPTYGERLRAVREALKLTQEQLASRMKMTRQGNLPTYENDKKRPSVQTILRHARACGQKPSEFLKDVVVTDYDRIRSGAYDDATENVQPKKPGESPASTTSSRRRAG